MDKNNLSGLPDWTKIYRDILDLVKHKNLKMVIVLFDN